MSHFYYKCDYSGNKKNCSHLQIGTSCIFDNKISGVAGFALSAYSLTDKEISNVTFADNNIENYTSSCLGVDETFNQVGCADILFGTYTNSVEYCGDLDIIILGFGVNNSFNEEGECMKCK